MFELSDNSFEIIMYSLLTISILALIIIKIKNKITMDNIEDLKSKIKPFEIKIDKDSEKMVPVDKLVEGNILSRNIYDHNNFPIFFKDMVVTEEIKQRLRDEKIGVVWVKLSLFKGFKK